MMTCVCEIVLSGLGLPSTDIFILVLTKLSFYHYEKYRQNFAICLLTPKQGPLIYHSLHFLCWSPAILSKGILPENHPLAPLHLPSVPWNKGKGNRRPASCQAGLNLGVSSLFFFIVLESSLSMHRFISKQRKSCPLLNAMNIWEVCYRNWILD